MRISVYLCPDLTDKLKQLAWTEHRNPRQQAELLLQQAIEQTLPVTVPQRAAPQQGEPYAQQR